VASPFAVISCPSCNEAKRLRGERDGEEVVVTCLTCGHVWRRHPDDCPNCGQRTFHPVRVPLMQKARGTQQSIIAYRMAKKCSACGFTNE